MFKVTITVSEGSGAGYGYPPHIYIGGTGIAISKSVKSAIRKASELAEIKKGKSAVRQGLDKNTSLIPVWFEKRIEKDGKMISQTF